MSVRLWNFLNGSSNLVRFLAKTQHILAKSLYFVNTMKIENKVNSQFKKPHFPLSDLRKINVLILKTGHPNWETHPQRLILMFQLGDIIITISKQLIGKGQIANE